MKFLLELHSLHRWVSAGVLRASLRISRRLNVRCFLFPVCSAVAFSKSSSICTHWLWGSFFSFFLQLSKLRDWKTCSALVIFFAAVAAAASSSPRPPQPSVLCFVCCEKRGWKGDRQYSQYFLGRACFVRLLKECVSEHPESKRGGINMK